MGLEYHAAHQASTRPSARPRTGRRAGERPTKAEQKLPHGACGSCAVARVCRAPDLSARERRCQGGSHARFHLVPRRRRPLRCGYPGAPPATRRIATGIAVPASAVRPDTVVLNTFDGCRATVLGRYVEKRNQCGCCVNGHVHVAFRHRCTRLAVCDLITAVASPF